jgi:hypothetical protein
LGKVASSSYYPTTPDDGPFSGIYPDTLAHAKALYNHLLKAAVRGIKKAATEQAKSDVLANLSARTKFLLHHGTFNLTPEMETMLAQLA